MALVNGLFEPLFTCIGLGQLEAKVDSVKLPFTYVNILIHSHMETRERVIGKQCKPRSDATSCGI